MEKFDVVWIIIGERGNLDGAAAERNAGMFKEAVASQSLRGIWPSIDGYDDDPRELFEIPEVRSYLCRWAQFAGIDTSADGIATRMHPAMLAVLAKCGVFDDVDPETVSMGTDH